jgi:hypothetical protein
MRRFSVADALPAWRFRQIGLDSASSEGEGFYYRWSHTKHHTPTLIVGNRQGLGDRHPALLRPCRATSRFVQRELPKRASAA